LILSYIIQAKAKAELVPAAEEGDLATVQDCLSKMANIEFKVVRSMPTCDVVSDILFSICFLLLDFYLVLKSF
jgi:hypothetical protein